MTDKTMRWIGFRGLGCGTLDGRHADEATNVYIGAEGVRKRNGYRQAAAFDGRVNAIVALRLGTHKGVLVYAGTHFFWKEDTVSAWQDITLSAANRYRVDPSVLQDRRIGVFAHDDRAYIVGCGDYLVLKYVGDSIELRRVEDEEDTYVPTTMAGIGCMSDETYVATTVDDQSVGVYFVKQNGVYTPVTLDADEYLPDPSLVYYRRVVTRRLGRKMEPANMLSSYRVNTLYGTDAAGATFSLDCDHIDVDSDTQIGIDVVENGQPVHYDVHARFTGDTRRTIVVGDDLSGKTLTVVEPTLTDVGTLRGGFAQIGVYELTATGGNMRWECSGKTATAWNTCALYVNTPTTRTLVATAARSNLLLPYVVQWVDDTITLPADFGVVDKIGTVAERAELTGTLPLLQSTITSGNADWGTLDYRNAQITFSRPTTPQGLADNITVRFKCRNNTFGAERIGQAKVGALYGVEGNNDRLFVGGADLYPTTDYYSESEDWTYFAPEGRTELGKQGQIAAYVKTGDLLLALLQGATDANAYWRRGVWAGEQAAVGDETFSVRYAVFGVVQTAVLPEVATPVGVGSVGSDVVYLAKDGLYRLVTNAYTDEKKARRMSGPIDDVAWGADAAAVVYDKRYLASTGKAVYVADSRYHLLCESESNYEWTVWDIADVCAWCTIDDALYFGTTDGRLCVFGDDWCDQTYRDAAAGQVYVDAAKSRLLFDAALGVSEGDEICFETNVYALWATPVDLSQSVVYVDSQTILHIYEGTTVYPVEAGVMGEPLIVCDVDWGKCCFGMKRANGAVYFVPNTLGGLLVNLKDSKVLLGAPDGDGYALCYAGGEEVTLYAEAPPIAPTARIVRRRPVRAVYAGETHALNTPDLSKVLTGVTVEVSSSLRGEATVSVRNSLSDGRQAVLGVGCLDFGWLDLGALSFDGDFPRSYTARLKLRFHYIQWKIESNNAGDLAIRGVCLRYRYLHPAKGVAE